MAGWMHAEVGRCDHAALTHIAEAFGIEGAGARVDHVVHGLALGEDGIGGRDAVRVLDGLGVDAYVSHGSMDTLIDHLREGRSVIIGGGPDHVYEVVRIDEARGTITFDSTAGGELPVRLASFEHAWAASANELVMSEGLVPDPDHILVSLHAPGITLVPIGPGTWMPSPDAFDAGLELG